MKSLNILAFGNSLTAGWTRGLYPHPYSIRLTSLLETALPQVNFTIDVQGQPGDMVVSPPGYYIPRMEALYKNNDDPYDWAIILGGTNDFSHHLPAIPIWQYLQRVWDYPLDAGTKILALTVPDQGVDDKPRDIEREQLNSWILSYEAKNFYTFDLNKAFPYWSLNEEERYAMWADDTHPSPEGYDIWGDLLAKRLLELIKEVSDVEEDTEVPVNPELKKRDLAGGGTLRKEKE